MINIAIIGGTGYTGVELLRLLSQHPSAKVRYISSRGEAGMAVADIYPNLEKHCNLHFCDPSEIDYSVIDLVFFCYASRCCSRNDRRYFVPSTP